MLVHVLGLGTLASQLGLGAYVTHYLFRASREAHSWRRAPRAPKFASGTVPLGTDWTGLV